MNTRQALEDSSKELSEHREYIRRGKLNDKEYDAEMHLLSSELLTHKKAMMDAVKRAELSLAGYDYRFLHSSYEWLVMEADIDLNDPLFNENAPLYYNLPSELRGTSMHFHHREDSATLRIGFSKSRPEEISRFLTLYKIPATGTMYGSVKEVEANIIDSIVQNFAEVLEPMWNLMHEDE